MPDPEVACESCGAAIVGTASIKARWCSTCRAFLYGLKNEEPVRLSEIVADLHHRTLNTPPAHHFAVCFEQFTDPSVTYTAWRCFLKVDGRVGRSSARPHLTPQEALRELFEMVTAG